MPQEAYMDASRFSALRWQCEGAQGQDRICCCRHLINIRIPVRTMEK